MVRFLRLRLWWLRQHELTRLWPFCWDCRQMQQAWRKGEFYAHDLPTWYFEHVFKHSEPVEIVEPLGPNLAIVDGQLVEAPRTYAGRATLWRRRSA